MIRVLTSLFLGMGLLVIAASFSVPMANAAPKPKVEVCHLPPGDPGNFHTITVNANALPAHLAHGDIEGACANAGEILCDDGDICTIDAFEPGTNICLIDEPVDCDDGDRSTRDSCDSALGCINEPIVEVPEPEVTAQSQNVTLPDGNPVMITLVGSSLDIQPGESLLFTTTQGSNGSVSTPVNIIPPDVQLCAITRGSCSTNAGCLGGANDVCELTTPASTTATVDYTPNIPATDDSFDFTVDLNGTTATATVSIFAAGDEGDTTPPEISTIESVDLAVQVLVGAIDESIIITGDAPGSVGDLSFTITTDPSDGTLTTPVPDVPDTGSVRSATVLYTHTGSGPGTDYFEFRVCDIAVPSSCNVTNGTVSIDINNPGELAPDRTYVGNINQPLSFDLAPSQ